MDTVTLTSEQRAALKLTRESNTAFYDHEQTLDGLPGKSSHRTGRPSRKPLESRIM